MPTMTIKVKVRWWVRPYIQSVALFCWMTGLHPDLDKVSRTVQRGIKLKLQTKPASSPDGLC